MKIFKNDAIRISVIYLLVTRIALILISYCVIHEFALHGVVKGNGFKYYDNQLINIWGTYDTGWYLQIAEEWYSEIHLTPDSLLPQYSFFPLYPALIRIIHAVTGINHFIAGLLISNVCLLVSGTVLFRLTEKLYNKDVAEWAVIFMYLFPVSFIFSGVFTESLYLMLILLTFYFALSDKWYASGITATFLVLCRPTGVFILLPLAF